MFVSDCASTSAALLELSLAVCRRSLKGFEGNCEIQKMRNSPAVLCMRLQMCINALFLEHFYGHCIKIKLYMHVFYSYLLKKDTTPLL